MFTAQGTVERIGNREWYDNRKGQTVTFWNFRLVGDQNQYNTGSVKPLFQPGQDVSFTYSTNAKGYHNADPKTINIGQGQPQAPQAAPAAPQQQPARPAPRTGGGTDWAAKDKYQKEVVEPRITFQASRSQAVELVAAALAADAISFGSTAKGKRLDMLLEYVDQVTDRFYLQAIHAPEHLERLKEEQAEVLAANNVDDVEDDLDY